MGFTNPALVLWIFSRMGVDVSASVLDGSFLRRWLVYGLNFLLTWGILVVLAWHLADERRVLGWQVACAVIASTLYGVLAAAHPRVKARSGGTSG
jgi:hypothetical protein